ncbi:MAG: hypothetical protein NDI61_13360, partial [Bdellovibrionaceae bacterium]|nr:hypothetical protein [Pseudobdellovibrionaceae bacterium]
KWDIRLGIAKLLESANAEDAKATLHYGLMLATPGEINQKARAELESRLNQVFKGPKDKVLLNVLDAFYESELSFDWKITFGIIKGMILLAQENYVSQTQFKAILAQQIKRLYLSKLPALGLNWLHQKIGRRLPEPRSAVPMAQASPTKFEATQTMTCSRIFGAK